MFNLRSSILMAGSVLALSAALAVEGEGRPRQLGPPDGRDQPGSHVHTWAGEARLYADAGRQRLVLGVDSFDAEQRRDRAVDQVFLFGTVGSVEPSISVRGQARLQYWHSGLRVTFPDDRRTFEFVTRDSALPPALAPPPFPLERFADLGGLAAYRGPLVESLSLDELESIPMDGPILDDGGGGPGGGSGAGGCDPKNCSVGCSNGNSCSASCPGASRANCTTCPDPVCGCAPC